MFTKLRKCECCGLFLKCFLDHVDEKYKCERCYNKKNAIFAGEEIATITMNTEAAAELYSDRGRRGLDAVLKDVRNLIAPDHALDCDRVNPMVELPLRGFRAIQWFQKVDA